MLIYAVLNFIAGFCNFQVLDSEKMDTSDETIAHNKPDIKTEDEETDSDDEEMFLSYSRNGIN